jgi:hypothetical protein
MSLRLECLYTFCKFAKIIKTKILYYYKDCLYLYIQAFVWSGLLYVFLWVLSALSLFTSLFFHCLFVLVLEHLLLTTWGSCGCVLLLYSSNVLSPLVDICRHVIYHGFVRYCFPWVMVFVLYSVYRFLYCCVRRMWFSV